MASCPPAAVACRLATDTVIVALPSRMTAEAAVTCCNDDPALIYESHIGTLTFVFARFTDGNNLKDAQTIELQVNDSMASLELSESVHQFSAALQLTAANRIALLATILGTVVSLFRLVKDQYFSRNIQQALEKLPARHLEGQCVLVGSNRTFILILPFVIQEEITFLVSSTKSAEGPRCILPSVIAVHREIDSTICCLQCEDSRHDIGEIYMSAPKAKLVKVTCKQKRYVTPAEFVEKTIRSMPALSALMLQHGDSHTAQAVIDAMNADGSLPPVLKMRSDEFLFAVEHTIPCARGVYISGWFRTSQRQTLRVELHDMSFSDTALERVWVTFAAIAEIRGEHSPVTGFCAWMERNQPDTHCVVPPMTVSNNGKRLGVCRAPPQTDSGADVRRRIIAAVHPSALENGALAKVYKPAISAMSVVLDHTSSIHTLNDLGRPSKRRSSVVIPLYGELKFLRTQIMSFATDEWVRNNCEIIYVLDDPRLLRGLEARLRSLARVSGLDIRLITLSRNLGFGPASNIGSANATGDTLFLMNSDVIPAAPGGLTKMYSMLNALPAYSIVGPKLLYADDTTQHAGMYFYCLPGGAFQNMHYYKGYGSQFEQVNIAREVPAVTGAMMALSRRDFEKEGGFSEEYIIGDYEDSDLCLKLRGRGGVSFYLPDAVFYHFERQSMPSQPSGNEAQTSAYNRQLHHEKWAGDIRRLMQRPEFLDGAHVY